MKLLVTGGTGFIGTPLSRTLVQQGHELLVLTRQFRPPRESIRFLAWQTNDWQRELSTVEGVINLAGESLAAKRWSPQQKQVLTSSRLHTTRALIEAVAASQHRPAVWINASAVGYYGARNDEPLTETDLPGRGFLAELCQAWEREAQRAEPLGVRVVRLRIGLVLGPGGGALAKMVPPFRACVGGPFGSGRQWISWIHRDDVIGLIEWALTQPHVSGAVNATAPTPVTMRDFCRALGRTLHRPSWAPVPAVVLRALLGEMSELLLTGQRVMPAVAQQRGYTFRRPELHAALEACLQHSHNDG